MQVVAGNVVGFKGRLIDRRYQPGQKYVQFFFETADGICVSVSRDADTVRRLRIGQKYAVHGQEFSVGTKTYIHEPEIMPVGPGFFQSRRRLVTVAAGLVLLAGISGTVFVLSHGSDSSATDRTIQASNASNEVAAPQPTDTPPATTAPASTDTGSETAPADTTTPPAAVVSPPPAAKKQTPASVPVSNPPQPPAAPAPTPEPAPQPAAEQQPPAPDPSPPPSPSPPPPPPSDTPPAP